MLLRFGVENFKSIRDYQELLLTSSRLKDRTDHLFPLPNLGTSSLPSVAIYGANASGKSNLLEAFAFMRKGILVSHNRSDLQQPIAYSPFLLDDDSNQRRSKFDCDFILGEVRYHYGFWVSRHAVEEEWLYAYPNGRRQVLFHRDNNDPEEPWYFGKHLVGRNRTLASMTRPDSLFVSTAAQNNHERLLEVYHYFKTQFVMRLDPLESLIKQIATPYRDSELRRRAVELLSAADIGITDLEVQSSAIPDEVAPLLSALQQNMTGVDQTPVKDLKIDQLLVGHKTNNGKTVMFNLEQESRGTVSLLAALPQVLDALENGKTYLVDELESSMHPLLSRRLVELFSSADRNALGAQLIFTTHDTNLLDATLLRRDQIWMMDKDSNNASTLTPLSDFHTRNTDNHEQGYLGGHYGGVPILGDWLQRAH